MLVGTVIVVVVGSLLYLSMTSLWFVMRFHLRDVRIARIHRGQEEMPEDPEKEFPSDAKLFGWALLWPVWLVWYPLLFALGCARLERCEP